MKNKVFLDTNIVADIIDTNGCKTGTGEKVRFRKSELTNLVGSNSSIYYILLLMLLNIRYNTYRLKIKKRICDVNLWCNRYSK